ncbi:SpoIIIAH-like family protein [Alkaliphilus serpentinus]|uniref:SpoIIIAH-like family protein n=1 Tax=Alkaliphilus serpentinus TaxID=1482731 RepID=A0A833HMJ0_9FIRM|nr:SpoIIIAH-like family protein [Alkaliphilus serpentinus]KAB3527572.1 SpoIIIAH-like family protein [Alkaliphilus serpentinus]
MKISGMYKKNFIIFSLVLMLGLIGYINYSLNKQSLLETSSDLEEYELMMLEEEAPVDIVVNEEEEGLAEVANPEDDYDTIIVDSLEGDIINDVANETSSEITDILTNKEMMSSSSYFIEGRLERDKRRSEMMSYLNDIIDNQYTSEDLRNQAQGMKLVVLSNTEMEMLIENMIIAKGFNDVIVYLGDDSINVIVQSEGLNEIDVAKIVDIITRETDIPMDNITIMEKK